MNIQEAVKKGQIFLKSKDIKTAELDCQILMSKVLKKEKEYLILNFQEKAALPPLLHMCICKSFKNHNQRNRPKCHAPSPPVPT